MAITAEIVKLDDVRRSRIKQFDISLSTLVTSGDERTGLVTVISDPKAIEAIRSELANDDIAMRGHLRDEVADIAGPSSFWRDIGPWVVYYNFCRKRNNLEIEGVFTRSYSSPNPSPPRSRTSALFAMVAAAIILCDIPLLVVYFYMQYAILDRGKVQEATIRASNNIAISQVRAEDGSKIDFHP